MNHTEDELEAEHGSANSTEDNGKVSITGMDTKIVLAQKIIANIKEELSNLERMLSSSSEAADFEDLVKRHHIDDGGDMYAPANDGKVVEGVFDGQHMVGSDGHQYAVPPNYASKSKLVEGDILKLSIQENGTFMFKQIGPIERQRIVGTLVRDEMTSDWRVVASGRKYAVLTATVSYHKGEAGDEAVILIPKAAPSKWAAVENIIKQQV